MNTAESVLEKLQNSIELLSQAEISRLAALVLNEASDGIDYSCYVAFRDTLTLNNYGELKERFNDDTEQ